MTINYGTHNAFTQTQCESYTWNGTTYTSSGNYLYNYTNASGCASTDTLHLTINIPATSLTQISICSSQLPYVWNALSITTSGIYNIHLTSSTSCDSIATLDLNVIQSPAAPVVNSPINYCQFLNASPLSPTANYPLIWYNQPIGGTGFSTTPIPSTTIFGIQHYYVSQYNGICESPRVNITIRVSLKPNLGIDKSISLCYNDSVNFAGLFNTTDLLVGWTYAGNPIATPGIVYTPGAYQIIASTGAGCSDTANVQVAVQPEIIANAGVDQIIESNQTITLQGAGGINFQWSPAGLFNNPGISNPTVQANQDTIVVLTVTDNVGCKDTDTLKIKVLDGPEIYMPNAFTPDGDGRNETIKPICVGIAQLEYFKIFDRFGKQVFESNTISKGWDGIYKNAKQPMGNYVYIIKATNRLGKSIFMKGNIVLIR